MRCPSGAAGCIANLEVIHLSFAAQLISADQQPLYRTAESN
jgi:hypothetical protein